MVCVRLSLRNLGAFASWRFKIVNRQDAKAPRKLGAFLSLWLIALTFFSFSFGQSSSSPPDKQKLLVEDGKELASGVWDDLKFTGTALGEIDRNNILPILLGSAFTAGLFFSDRDTSDALTTTTKGDLEDASEKFEDIVGPATMTAGAAGLYFFGLLGHHDYERETGLLALRAIISGNAIITPVRMLLGRERPFLSRTDRVNLNGPTTKDENQSFVSRHAVTSWTLAAVLTHRYPDQKWMPYTLYPAAATVTLFRAVARDHFLSDLFVGGVLGYFLGRRVVRQSASPGTRDGVQISPAIDPQTGGAGIVITF